MTLRRPRSSAGSWRAGAAPAPSAGAVTGSPAAGGEQLDSGASRQQPGEQLAHELFAAVERNSGEALQLALASGLDMNARDFMGRTPLHRAARVAAGAHRDAEADGRQSAQPLHGRGCWPSGCCACTGVFSDGNAGQQWEARGT